MIIIHDMKTIIKVLFSIMLCAIGVASAAPLRNTVSLDGMWQVAEGSMTDTPTTFERTVAVPGLLDMAQPPFEEVGPKKHIKVEAHSQKDPRRDAFWYRRTFTVSDPIPAVAVLKVNKAMFGMRVFLNGQMLGDHKSICTPGLFNAKPALKIGENELVIRVGADRDALGLAHLTGFDMEKIRYIPGIFDSVSLTLTGSPHIENVQVAPEIESKEANVRIYLAGDKETAVEVEVREAVSGKLAGEARAVAKAGVKEIDVTVPIADCRLWSPEDPFLYKITVRTSGDEFTTRFGMREFYFDPETRRAMLNGKPYFMRGSNITLYRFFEDDERGALPWNEEWVRTLHRRAKEMHWNSLRYSIGLPPERWYEIADEEGILIQNEFPIWSVGEIPPAVTEDQVAAEFTGWLHDQWNHPSVVIWDASNETRSQKLANVIARVRGLDLSNRPWDNGYMKPQMPGDTSEQHIYHYNCAPEFRPKTLGTLDYSEKPEIGANKNPVIVNEYGWLWVNRNGTPTQLTQYWYRMALGNSATPAQLFRTQALWLAADTEFWRAHRHIAALLHFCMLTHSRPDPEFKGATSDNWTQGVANLEWEPEFYKYVRDAFAPVGLMLNLAFDKAQAGEKNQIPLILINDLDAPWSGPVTLRLKSGDRVVLESTQEARIDPFGTTDISFEITWPKELGTYMMEAELNGKDKEPVRSFRELVIRDKPASLAGYAKATASSVQQAHDFKAERAIDGVDATYWSSEFQDDASLTLEWDEAQLISRIDILWQEAYAKAFTVEISMDGNSWSDVYKTDSGKGGTTEIQFSPAKAKYVRLNCTKRGTNNGNAVREIEVFP